VDAGGLSVKRWKWWECGGWCSWSESEKERRPGRRCCSSSAGPAASRRRLAFQRGSAPQTEIDSPPMPDRATLRGDPSPSRSLIDRCPPVDLVSAACCCRRWVLAACTSNRTICLDDVCIVMAPFQLPQTQRLLLPHANLQHAAGGRALRNYSADSDGTLYEPSTVLRLCRRTYWVKVASAQPSFARWRARVALARIPACHGRLASDHRQILAFLLLLWCIRDKPRPRGLIPSLLTRVPRTDSNRNHLSAVRTVLRCLPPESVRPHCPVRAASFSSSCS
jgi:hypothetical protein